MKSVKFYIGNVAIISCITVTQVEMLISGYRNMSHSIPTAVSVYSWAKQLLTETRERLTPTHSKGMRLVKMNPCLFFFLFLNTRTLNKIITEHTHVSIVTKTKVNTSFSTSFLIWFNALENLDLFNCFFRLLVKRPHRQTNLRPRRGGLRSRAGISLTE